MHNTITMNVIVTTAKVRIQTSHNYAITEQIKQNPFSVSHRHNNCDNDTGLSLIVDNQPIYAGIHIS